MKTKTIKTNEVRLNGEQYVILWKGTNSTLIQTIKGVEEKITIEHFADNYLVSVWINNQIVASSECDEIELLENDKSESIKLIYKGN